MTRTTRTRKMSTARLTACSPELENSCWPVDSLERVSSSSSRRRFKLTLDSSRVVSRTATAPFDRLKVYLITSPSTQPPPDAKPCPKTGKENKFKKGRQNKGSIPAAVRAVLKQGGGVKAFWTGNGLNVVKIFPVRRSSLSRRARADLPSDSQESAIKFLSYESAKRVFAQYWDHVPDQTMISNSSRFVAGGIGGVVSQFGELSSHRSCSHLADTLPS